MQYDNEQQKQLVIKALSDLTLPLRESRNPQFVQIVNDLVDGAVITPEVQPGLHVVPDKLEPAPESPSEPK